MQNREEVIKRNIEMCKKRRKRRIIGFLVFLFFMLISVFIILSVTVLFPVKRIVVKNESIYTREEIVNASGIDNDSNMILLSKGKVTSKISKKLAKSGGISVEKIFPDTIKLTVKTATPKYYLTNDGYFCVMDSDFKFIETTEEPPEKSIYIKLKTKFKHNLGETVAFSKEEDELMKTILKLTSNKGFDVSGIDVSDDVNIKFIANGRIVVELGTNVDMEYKIKRFSAMYEKMSDKAQGVANMKAFANDNTKSLFKDVKIDVYNFCGISG